MNRLTLVIMMCVAYILSSCMDTGDLPPEVHGDPQIVDSFDFATAWKEAAPTFGSLVDLKVLKQTDTTVRYARSGHYNLPPKSSNYDYLEPVRTSESLREIDISDKGIINDIGDTILYTYGETSSEASTQIKSAITHVGIGLIYSHVSTYGGESSQYLVTVNNKPYDLMKTMKSTYRTIKYLQTIYPDSMIPMGIFENDPK